MLFEIIQKNLKVLFTIRILSLYYDHKVTEQVHHLVLDSNQNTLQISKQENINDQESSFNDSSKFLPSTIDSNQNTVYYFKIMKWYLNSYSKRNLRIAICCILIYLFICFVFPISYLITNKLSDLRRFK